MFMFDGFVIAHFFLTAVLTASWHRSRFRTIIWMMQNRTQLPKDELAKSDDE